MEKMTSMSLPERTRERIAALMTECGHRTMRDCVIAAVDRMWLEELGPERNYALELDALAARVAALEDSHA